MERQVYCSEIESILIQFLSAFDGTKIVRKRINSDETKIVSPRWIIGNKTRTFNDIVNQAGNITLPCGVVEPNSISLKKDAIFNQQSYTTAIANGVQYRHRQPLPVEISVSVTFYTKTFTDLYQMFSNFAVYSNPYFFISLSVPSDIPKEKFNSEYRCKAEWDGTFNVDYPKSLGPEELWLIKGTANFTIEAYLFKSPITDPSGIIYAINQAAYPSLYSSSFLKEDGLYDFYVKEGWPSVNKIFIGDKTFSPDENGVIPVSSKTAFSFDGYSFFQRENVTVILEDPRGRDIPDLQKITISTVKNGDITGFALPEDHLLSISDNIITMRLPDIKDFTSFKVSIVTNIGYYTVPRPFMVI